eukprot:TRINITY_DN51610_c0_g1_i2.p1 TRINITY_DN51610_c0_g1~~TRINITY_DN51610_c0_g1_i2.p1  ORF type:complete len:221 (-),score=15.98 TRINITY_DN51610_c0_g1_i2:929-1591(-)
MMADCRVTVTLPSGDGITVDCSFSDPVSSLKTLVGESVGLPSYCVRILDGPRCCADSQALSEVVRADGGEMVRDELHLCAVLSEAPSLLGSWLAQFDGEAFVLRLWRDDLRGLCGKLTSDDTTKYWRRVEEDVTTGHFQAHQMEHDAESGAAFEDPESWITRRVEGAFHGIDEGTYSVYEGTSCYGVGSILRVADPGSSGDSSSDSTSVKGEESLSSVEL